MVEGLQENLHALNLRCLLTESGMMKILITVLNDESYSINSKD